MKKKEKNEKGEVIVGVVLLCVLIGFPLSWVLNKAVTKMEPKEPIPLCRIDNGTVYK